MTFEVELDLLQNVHTHHVCIYVSNDISNVLTIRVKRKISDIFKKINGKSLKDLFLNCGFCT